MKKMSDTDKNQKYITENDIVNKPRKEALEKVSEHLKSKDKDSILHYSQNRVCGTKPELPCRPVYFSAVSERYP